MDDFEGGDIEIDPEVTGSGAATSTSMKGVSSQLGAASAGVDAETKAKMDPVFLEFLADICSNRKSTLSHCLLLALTSIMYAICSRCNGSER